MFDGSRSISFTTISKGQHLLSLKVADSQPELIVLSNSEDAESFIRAKLVDSARYDIVEKLRKNDYNQSTLVLVSQGVKGSDGYDVNVQEVRFKDSDVLVYADFATPQRTGLFGGRVIGPMSSSPYQLISFPREAVQGGSLRFALVVDGDMLVKVEHSI
ncbi:MAG TPA: hypothetical protein VFS21_07030 [Roseiflexaceae bacterium]|nr:hypothetical protein [Roseiflexaceae bacterium]